MSYARMNTVSDGGKVYLSGLGSQIPTTEIDYVPDYWDPKNPNYLDPFILQRAPISGEGFPGASLSPELAAPEITHFNPPQGQVVVVTDPGQRPRLIVQTPGIYVDTSQIGQRAAPSVGDSLSDLTNWLQRNTIFASAPNWLVLLGAFAGYKMLAGEKR